ncbi:MAG: D-alanyl-D-alanine carboxypeptidase [Candidatus Eisenbacteria bacterium]|nr:D-alanyl-D-alanine carboxypeptidase [Candidatus Eisenbacteria bacterium]
MTLLLAAILAASPASPETELARLVRVGGVHVEDDSGTVLLSWHSDEFRTPASVMKLATAAAALHALGPKARLTTDFVFDPVSHGLCVVGGGDPFLVSESLRRAADSLAALGVTDVSRLSADCGLFVQPLEVDGLGVSANPYDAGVSAFSVNFNTVAVSIGANGTIGSGEPETPLTPIAREMGKKAGRRGDHRLPIRNGVTTAPLYALELLREILRERGISVGDSTSLEPCTPSSVRYRHQSQQSVEGVVAAMLEYSNNVIANMLMLAAAARENGGRPVGMADGVAMVRAFLADELRFEGFEVKEGSGLSRANRLTPRQIVALLHHLRDHGYDLLLPLYKGVRAKTGTLAGVTCLAGYMTLQDGRTASFAILLEGNVGLRDRVLTLLKGRLAAAGDGAQ